MSIIRNQLHSTVFFILFASIITVSTQMEPKEQPSQSDLCKIIQVELLDAVDKKILSRDESIQILNRCLRKLRTS